jgi:hypothetical protein
MFLQKEPTGDAGGVTTGEFVELLLINASSTT